MHPLTVAALLSLGACSGRVPTGETPATTSSPAPQPYVSFEEDSTSTGLKVELFDALPTSGAGGPAVPVAPSTALDSAAVDKLLTRVGPLKGAEGDRKTFALRPGSKPPPLSGSDVTEVFPPPVRPPVVSVPTGPVKVVRYMPEGEVPMAPHVSLTFDQPMVAVTSQEEAAKTVPAKLSPQPAGHWRWLGTKTLLFDPEPRMPMATEFTVEVPAGTASATGTKLAEALRFTFATPPPTLQGSWPTDGPHDLHPVILLSFDQRVDAAAVLPHVVLNGASPVKLRLATAEEIAADPETKSMSTTLEAGRWVALTPYEPLPKDTHFTVQVQTGTPSAEGPRTTTADQWGSFYTYAPLSIAEHHCSWYEACPPTVPWMIRFDNALDAAKFDASGFTVSPAVPGLSVRADGDTVQITGAFVGRTTYTVTVPATVTDTYGQTLGKAEPVVFQVGPAEKTLDASGDTMVVLDPAGGAVLPVWSTNHSALKVTIHAVDPGQYGAWLKWLESIYYNDNRPKRLPGRLVYQGTVTPPDTRDSQVETPIDFGPYCTDGTGQFVVLIEPTVQPRDKWNRQYVYRWVQVTRLGMTAFIDGTHAVGWVTDLSTGDAAVGAKLSLQSGGPTADTGPDGLAALDLPEYGDDEGRPDVLVARRGTDLAILPEAESPWNGSGWIRRSQLDQLRWYVADDRGLYRPGEQARIKGWLRLWEPGPTGDIAALKQSKGTIGWTLTSSMGNELGKGEVPLSGLGGFELDVTFPPDVNLGTANLLLEARGIDSVVGLTASHPLQIQEFRRPEFEVTGDFDAPAHSLGERATVDLSASYYAGGGLPNAEVIWDVFASPASYVPPGWASYSFGTWSPWWMDYGRSDEGGDAPVGHFVNKTDGGGASHLGIHFLSMNPARPMTVRAEGTVLDVNRQAWTRTTTTLLHPASVYVGLETDRSFVEKGKPVDVRLALVDIDGKPVVGEAELSFARMEWGRSPDGRYRENPTDPQPCTAKADVAGLASCSFPTVTGGNYRILATVRDPLGRKNESEVRIWVSGADVTPARDVEMEALTLVPEQKDLRAGQTARILVVSPFFPAEGTLTLRRDGLVRTERFRMTEATTTLEVPIVDDYVPNLLVQVNLVGAAARLDDAGKADPKLPKRIAHAEGSIAFDVPPLSRTLTVTATPAAEAVQPGSETTIALQVTGADGKPVQGAELAVVVADESVLALTGYHLPDPLDLFYAAREPGVSDYHLRSFVALSNPATLSTAMGPDTGKDGLRYDMAPGGAMADDDGAPMTTVTARAAPMLEESSVEKKSAAPLAKAKSPARGPSPAPPVEIAGGQPGPAIEMRTDFSALALFAPDVRTDAAGHAVVPLKVPDSLTRYRIMVVAVDADHAFGSADSAITARLPLMVRPSAPRFLNFGDQVELPVVLQNQTDAPMTVDVAVRGTNVRFVDAIGPSLPDMPDVAFSTAGKRVTVPANDRVEVRFPAATLMAGTARFQAVGAAGDASDAATFELPVWTPATTEAFATYGEIDDAKGLVQPVQAPPGSWPQFGGLEVTASSTQLQALTDAVLYLQSYPFECNEQLASRVLGIASLRDVLSAFDAEGLPPAADLEDQVKHDLDRLARRQNWDGGFAFWRKGDESWPFLSIHVANAFARAKAKGYDVPEDAWSRSRSHLESIESYIPSYYSDEARWFLEAYALDVRRRMGDADVKKAQALYKEAGTRLGIDGLAFLLPTLFDGKATVETDAILRHLGNNVTESAGAAHFVTSYTDGEYLLLHSDRRADGIVLEALIETKPDAELVAKVVRGLLAHKTKGRWGNTEENAFILLALDRYFRVYEKETPDFVARIWLGDGYVGDHTFKGRTTERAHFEVPMGFLTETRDPQPLTVVRDGPAGRLYYRIGVKYAPRDLRLEPADYGFAVDRRYEAIDDPGDVRHDPDGIWHIRAGARVRVHLSMATEMRRYHVALVDPLPAGLEAQNPVLATTGTLPQSPPDEQPKYWWWSRPWWEHENLRDERVEAFTSLLWDGVHEYDYIARATTPGRFVVPPTKAEEMYSPETFGRGGTDIVLVE